MRLVGGAARLGAGAMAVAVMSGAYVCGNALGRAAGTTSVPAPIAAVSPAPSLRPPGSTQSPGRDLPAEAGGTRTAGPIGTGPAQIPPDWFEGGGPFGAHRSTGAAYVALTFDDGPDPQWTPEVLKLLRRYEVQATFCVIGRSVVAHPELVAQIVLEGHTLCNHSWDHDIKLGRQSAARIRDNLARTTAAIQQAAPGAPVRYYRQPGGEWTDRVVRVAAELGMTSLHWQVDPKDWCESEPAIVAAVDSATKPGDIVLLHDGGGERQPTVRALATILPRLLRRATLAPLPPYPPPSAH